MKHKTLLGSGLKCLALCTALWGVIAPWAVAGPQQDTETAEKEFARGDMVAAMTLWKKAAEEGYAPAQVRLGDILDKSEEDEDAVMWYRKAAEQGSAAGEYGLGQMYAKGEGVKQDFEQGRSYVLKAAEKGYLPALIMMMNAYRYGSLGVAANPAQAAAWEAKVLAQVPDYNKAPPIVVKGQPKKGEVK